MKEKKQSDIEQKKLWQKPDLYTLNIRNTEGGPYANQTEDFQSGSITQN
jgi:hypothetical protein